MPYLKIQISRELEPEQSKALLTLASRTVASELGKPEQYVMVEIATNPSMLFAGTDEPSAFVELKSIGLPASRIKTLSRVLCALLEDATGIAATRIYIEFTDAQGSHWGWNRSTF